MSTPAKISRRQFIRLAGLTSTGAFLAACKPLAAPAHSSTAPAVIKPRTVVIQMNGGHVTDTREILTRPLFVDFSRQTGIEIEIVPRQVYKEEELKLMADAVQAGASPFDIIDYEDELTTVFAQAGYMHPLDDLLPPGFWGDFPPEMKAYSQQWSTFDGALYRVSHNWEMSYWWYRKDWFDEQGVTVPTTWDEVREMGQVFTDEGRNVWASADGLMKGGYMNVYLAWMTLQAGGSPFELGGEYQMALETIDDLLHKDRVFDPASFQSDYVQLMRSYVTNRVAFMRQWPTFYDVSRSPENSAWFNEDKTVCALPPVGPGGKGGSTYAATWGFGLVKTAPNLDAAKEVFQFLVSPEAAAEMAASSVWYLSARKSVLDRVGDQGLARMMKMYTDAGVVGVRPYHPKFFEAITILEDTAAAFLTGQIKLEESIRQARERLEKLGEMG